MISVEGRWALVTGASRGIGALIAEHMARNGCNLILHSRRRAHAEHVMDVVKGNGVEAYAVEAELSEQQVVDMLEQVEAVGTVVDIVFNNAGVQVAYREDYYNTPMTDFDLSFRINFLAPVTICYHYLPRMQQRGFGRVINTTSGIRNEPEQAGYSASKAALDKFTMDLGSKLDGTDVLMNLTDPGWCRTDLGGPDAPSAPESSIPGVVIGAFIDDRKSGRMFRASDYTGMPLEDAVRKAEASGDTVLA